MADKKQYYKLDEIGIVGSQNKKSSASIKYHQQKTGEFFQKLRSATGKSNVKKAS